VHLAFTSINVKSRRVMEVYDTLSLFQLPRGRARTPIRGRARAGEGGRAVKPLDGLGVARGSSLGRDALPLVEGCCARGKRSGEDCFLSLTDGEGVRALAFSLSPWTTRQHMLLGEGATLAIALAPVTPPYLLSYLSAVCLQPILNVGPPSPSSLLFPPPVFVLPSSRGGRKGSRPLPNRTKKSKDCIGKDFRTEREEYVFPE